MILTIVSDAPSSVDPLVSFDPSSVNVDPPDFDEKVNPFSTKPIFGRKKKKEF